MRELILVRHAIAEDHEEAARRGVQDPERGLTEKGIARMKQAARGLAWLLDTPAVIAHSPLRRARETAQLLSRALAGAPLEETPALAPDAPRGQLYQWLAARPDGSLCLAVGHEPDLGHWALGALAGEAARGSMPFRKGGAARLLFPGDLTPGAAELDWFLPPRALRALAGR